MKIRPILDWFHKLRVTLVMRSGERYVFLVDKVTWKRSGDGVGLTELGWEGAKGAPSFVTLSQVDLLFSKRVLRWDASITNS